MSVNETAVDRLAERLKQENMGGLLDEKDLSELARKAFEKAFFEPTRTVHNRGSYNERVVLGDPPVIEMMRGVLKERVQAHFDAWIAENGDQLVEFWKQALDKGIMRYAEELREKQATETIRKGLQPMMDLINQDRMQRGLPAVYF